MRFEYNGGENFEGVEKTERLNHRLKQLVQIAGAAVLGTVIGIGSISVWTSGKKSAETYFSENPEDKAKVIKQYEEDKNSKDLKTRIHKKFESQYAQLKKLKEKENLIRNIFGDLYKQYQAADYEASLKRQENNAYAEVLATGKFTVRNILNLSLGEGENKESESITIEPIPTAQGLMTKKDVNTIITHFSSRLGQ